MLKKRIIPCLDIKNGRTVKGVNFTGLIDAGDPVELAREYARQGADELVLLDISATTEKRRTMIAIVERVAAAINIPFTVGGGIGSVEDAAALIQAGADKISINSAAYRRPTLIADIASRFGSQCVVVAIDTNYIDGAWNVFLNGGSVHTGAKAVVWAQQAAALGAGELLLTSMANDGTKAGFALDIANEICEVVDIPVIASGGAGRAQHFLDLFSRTKANAALGASIFHYREMSIPDVKNYLRQNQIPIR